MSALEPLNALAINRDGWNAIAPKFFGAAALPSYGPHAPTEDQLQLLGDVQGQTALEFGCGSGHSLVYLAQHGAAALWGLDLSTTQISTAERVLGEQGVQARLFVSPMEQNPGIPTDAFDLILSLYALGWTTDLDATLRLAASYLKPGGRFVFSWEHPTFTCIDRANGAYIVSRPYRDNHFLKERWSGVPIVMHFRQVSTFVNGLIRAGLRIDQLLEPTIEDAAAFDADEDAKRWYSIAKATLIPTTLIIVASKPY